MYCKDVRCHIDPIHMSSMFVILRWSLLLFPVHFISLTYNRPPFICPCKSLCFVLIFCYFYFPFSFFVVVSSFPPPPSSSQPKQQQQQKRKLTQTKIQPNERPNQMNPCSSDKSTPPIRALRPSSGCPVL